MTSTSLAGPRMVVLLAGSTSTRSASVGRPRTTADTCLFRCRVLQRVRGLSASEQEQEANRDRHNNRDRHMWPGIQSARYWNHYAERRHKQKHGSPAPHHVLVAVGRVLAAAAGAAAAVLVDGNAVGVPGGRGARMWLVQLDYGVGAMGYHITQHPHRMRVRAAADPESHRQPICYPNFKFEKKKQGSGRCLCQPFYSSTVPSAHLYGTHLLPAVLEVVVPGAKCHSADSWPSSSSLDTANRVIEWRGQLLFDDTCT